MQGSKRIAFTFLVTTDSYILNSQYSIIQQEIFNTFLKFSIYKHICKTKLEWSLYVELEMYRKMEKHDCLSICIASLASTVNEVKTSEAWDTVTDQQETKEK